MSDNQNSGCFRITPRFSLHTNTLYVLDFARNSVGDVTIDTTHKTPEEIYIEALDKLKYHEAI